MEQTKHTPRQKAIAVIMLILFSLLILLIAAAMELASGGHYMHKLMYPADCAFVVPPGYKIVYNSERKLYAVLRVQFNDYLCDASWGITAYSATISEPSLFDNDCDARGYLKAYLKDREPKITNFK